MNSVIELTENAWSYIRTIGVADTLDILLVAFLIYELTGFIRKTNTARLAKGIVILLVIFGLSNLLGLKMISFLLGRSFELGLFALIILFQPELRRLLEKMGSSSRLSGLFGSEFSGANLEGAITQTVLACSSMSETRTGALIIFERDNQLSEQMRTGTHLDAEVTAELLKNIFFVKAPLHDGAVIIRDGRIASAGCMLPMSGNLNLSKDLGMRHRAGIGMSERSDAVVLIVSEETGAISIAVDGMLKRHLTRETAETLLRRELLMSDDMQKNSGKGLLGLIRGRKNEQ